jgi:hypothetical protein
MDRIPSDNPSVTTFDATLERRGRLDRPKVVLDAGRAAPPTDEVVRLHLDGDEYRVYPTENGGKVEIDGAYDTPDAARDPRNAENRLTEWVESKGLDYGRTVHLDCIEAEFAYGLRAPGERTVYPAVEKPSGSLSDIAEGLED